ncbi:MAG: phosphotransferase family protein, partial [Eggerthellaceae bacterium]|nr:phosphotransferase family protein [Eggerthellaceae bacterium]
ELIQDLDASAMPNICQVLHCEAAGINFLDRLHGGLTNKTWLIEVAGKKYTYRQPGVGTEEITNRKYETECQNIAAKLGIDGTFIYEDPQVGWKISHYVECDEPFSCHNEAHLVQALQLLRTLHQSGATIDYVKDMHEDTIKQMALLEDEFRTKYDNFEDLFAMAERYNKIVKDDGIAPVLCHNDFYDPNFLIHGDQMDLIDWEYAGMSDYASDLAVFVCCSDYTYEDTLHFLELYFQRPPTRAELIHCIAYIQVISFHWLVWALSMAQTGEPVGPLEGIYHNFASEYGAHAAALLESND